MNSEFLKKLPAHLYPYEDLHQRRIDDYFRSIGAKTGMPVGRESPQKGLDVIICYTNRCGSNLLAHGLHKAGNFSHISEMLDAEAVIRISRENKIPDYFSYIRLLKRAEYTQYGKFGFKAGCRQLLHITSIGAIPHIIPDPKFVYISRGDTLSQAISLQIAQQTNAWHSGTKADLTRIVFNEQAIIQNLKGITECNALFEYYFALHGVKPIRVFYEDLCASYGEVISEVLGALDVEVTTEASLNEVPLKKQASKINHDFMDQLRSRYGMRTETFDHMES